MSSMWERALGWLRGVRPYDTDPIPCPAGYRRCEACEGAGWQLRAFYRAGTSRLTAQQAVICSVCEGRGSVDGGGSSEAVSGEAWRGVPGLEPGTHEASSGVTNPTSLAKLENVDAPSKPSDRPKARVEADPDGVGVAVSEGVEDSGKPGRLAVAPLTVSERSKAYREAHREEYNVRAKERMKARRDLMRKEPTKLIMPPFSTDEEVEAAEKLVQQAHDPPKPEC